MTTTKEESEGFISDRIDEAVLYSSNAYKLFSDFMASLADSSKHLADIGSINTDVGSLNNYRVGRFSGSPPSWDGATVQDVEMPTLTPFFTIEKVGDITIPDVDEGLDAPSTDVLFYEQNYISTVLSTLQDTIVADFAGGTGLSAEVEEAIYSRDADRRERESAKRVEEIQYNFVGRGFSVPQGALTSALQQEGNARTLALQDQSRDVMIQAATMEQENAKTNKQYAVQLESILLDSHNKVQDRVLKAEDLRLSSAIEVWKSSWERYRALMDVAKLEADIELGKLQATTSANNAIAQMNISKIEAAKAEIDLEVAKIDAEVKSFSASVDSFSSFVKAYEVEEGSSIRGFEANVKQVEAKASLEIKAAEANIQAVIAVRSLLLEAAKSGANVSAQALASALNSVNAAVSFGHHSSYSETDSYSYDQTKGLESGATTQNIHNFDESKA